MSNGTYVKLPPQPVTPLPNDAIDDFVKSRNDWEKKSIFGKLFGALFGSKKYLVIDSSSIDATQKLVCRTLKLGESPANLLAVKEFCVKKGIPDASLKPYYSDALYHSLTRTSFPGMRSVPQQRVSRAQMIEMGKQAKVLPEAPANVYSHRSLNLCKKVACCFAGSVLFLIEDATLLIELRTQETL